jgi:hypothetical protein
MLKNGWKFHREDAKSATKSQILIPAFCDEELRKRYPLDVAMPGCFIVLVLFHVKLFHAFAAQPLHFPVEF